MTVAEVIADYEAMRDESICVCAIKQFAANIFAAIRNNEVASGDLPFTEFDVKMRLVDAIASRMRIICATMFSQHSSINDALCAAIFIRKEIEDGVLTWKQSGICPVAFRMVEDKILTRKISS